MSVRTSMGDLITRIRTLVNDPSPDGFPHTTGTVVWTDQQLQDFLDRHQTVVRYAQLQPAPSMTTGGVISYLEYVAGDQDWEADVALADAAFAALTPATSDLINGVWTFAASTVPPVFATGKVYDVHWAAADVLEAWAAKVALRFDFATSDQRFQASQQREALLEVAQVYRSKAKPKRADMVRADAMRPDLHYLNSADLWGARW